MMIAMAALDVAGRSDRTVCGNDLPKDRRVYLYAVPDHAVVGGEATISALTAATEKADFPMGVDWDRNSETYGLRFMPSFVRAPQSLQAFTSEKAREDWRGWKSREKAISRVVAKLAGMIAHEPGVVLEEGSPVEAGEQSLQSEVDVPPARPSRPRRPGREEVM